MLKELQEIRRLLTGVQLAHLVPLCAEDGAEQTPIQRAFSFLLWEIDQEIRNLGQLDTGLAGFVVNGKPGGEG